MRHIISTLALCLMVGLFVSCGPSKAEKDKIAKADSIMRADSIAKAEEARIEQAMQDSIEQARQDSIAKIEEFQSKIPSFSRLYNSSGDELRSYLTGLGFQRSKKGNYDNEGETITYTLSVDKTHYCVCKEWRGYEWDWFEITVVGAPEKWQEAKSEATRLKRKLYSEEESNCSLDIEGNTIKWGCGA